VSGIGGDEYIESDSDKIAGHLRHAIAVVDLLCIMTASNDADCMIESLDAGTLNAALYGIRNDLDGATAVLREEARS
jgi:hypothetical protein